MATEPLHFLTPERYLELDAEAERPSEYFNGFMVEVEASTPNHGSILTNLIYSITDLIRKSELDCQLRSQGQRVYLPAVSLYAYPDIVITCGVEEYGPTDTLLNPIILIEVLSPTTADYDCGRKFEYYRSIKSLREYITVAQDRVDINNWVILNGKWTLNETHVAMEGELQILGSSIAVRDVYRKVKFEETE
jgi:Uma2 family endonuclease